MFESCRGTDINMPDSESDSESDFKLDTFESVCTTSSNCPLRNLAKNIIFTLAKPQFAKPNCENLNLAKGVFIASCPLPSPPSSGQASSRWQRDRKCFQWLLQEYFTRHVISRGAGDAECPKLHLQRMQLPHCQRSASQCVSPGFAKTGVANCKY